MIYDIPEQNVQALEQRIARLSRQTVKAGNPALTLRRTGHTGAKESGGRLVRTVQVEVNAEVPAHNGWSFAATVVVTTEGVVLRSVPGTKIPIDYRSGTSCEHCQVHRNRKDLYLLQHADGRVVRVGRSCLGDFLQHEHPGRLSLAAKLCLEAHAVAQGASEAGWLGGASVAADAGLDLITYLEYVAQTVLDQSCYVSRSTARNTGRMATADMAMEVMTAGNRTISPEAAQLAQEARDYVCEAYGRSLFEVDGKSIFGPDGRIADVDLLKQQLMKPSRHTLSDFEHNLLVVANNEVIDRRLTGVAAYIVEVYRRSQRKAVHATTLNTEGLRRIHTMFNTAVRAGLKRPVVRLADASGLHLTLKLAGPTSANAGCIYVLSGSTYCGKVTDQSLFKPSRECPAGVPELLEAFAADPETAATQHGRLEGCCCFCGRKLTDARSTAVGFGPVCALRFGLRVRTEMPEAPVDQELLAV